MDRNGHVLLWAGFETISMFDMIYIRLLKQTKTIKIAPAHVEMNKIGPAKKIHFGKKGPTDSWQILAAGRLDTNLLLIRNQ